ncbi:MAG: hypothetical protein P4L28_02995 [Paludibacteraceae bacterium]|nr:hypothetical protein [Paludibacteraceae bacterium]
MENNLDNYYLRQKEPYQSCLLALKDIIMSVNTEIFSTKKYQIPFFYYKDMKLAFVWLHEKKVIVAFIKDKKTLPITSDIKQRDQIETLQVDPNTNIPIEIITKKLRMQLETYNKFLSEK